MKSQLRQDLVTGDWIVIAPGRATQHITTKKGKRITTPLSKCPFENLEKSGNGKPILVYGELPNWKIKLIQNKYPAFIHQKKCAPILQIGPYSVAESSGHHDLAITRDHQKNFPKLSFADATEVFEVFRARYRMFLKDQCLAYISIFHNWGPTAGASVAHPHYQIIALPIIPPDIMHSLEGSSRFFKAQKKCVHCVMIASEAQNKKRVLYENDRAIAFAPFFSKNPFEIRVFPKRHFAYFEDAPEEDISSVVEALQYALKKIEKNLHLPDYNFFIHTAPIQDKESHSLYHWHIEIVPKLTIDAGFELSTGVEINVVDPDMAVRMLKR